MFKTITSFFRLIRVGFVLARHAALIPREIEPQLGFNGRLFGRFVRLVARGGPTLRPGQRYGHAFEALGPVFIKLGQVLSTRADIFGTEFCDDLKHLKDELPPFDTGLARLEIERALEQPIETAFSEFGAVLGAASIAQAHAAILKDGRRVAVKTLRPRIETRITHDVDMLNLAAGLINALVPEARRLEPKAFAATVAETLRLELDLRLEASAADEIGTAMAKSDYMRVPKVVWPLVAKRVLVTEWANGSPLSKPETLDLPGLDRIAIADKLIRAFLTQALDYGVFHADLHEGNLFVAAPSQIIAIDFGIVGRLKPRERLYLAEMLWGFLRRDYKRVAEVHFEAGYVPAHHDVLAFAQALRAVGEPVLGLKATDVSMGRLLSQLFEITAQFDMHLRPELVLLQKTMVSVEGVARRLYPEHNLWEAARPVVKAFIARELSLLAQTKRFFETLKARIEAPPPDPDAALRHELEALRQEVRQNAWISTLGWIAALGLASAMALIWVLA